MLLPSTAAVLLEFFVAVQFWNRFVIPRLIKHDDGGDPTPCDDVSFTGGCSNYLQNERIDVESATKEG